MRAKPAVYIIASAAALLTVTPLSAEDLSKSGARRSAQSAPGAVLPNAANPYAAPNPYAPAPLAQPAPTAASDRAADAYATGFAIGLGTALITKQQSDDVKRR